MRKHLVVSGILLIVAILALTTPWYSVAVGQQASQTVSQTITYPCAYPNQVNGTCTVTVTSFSNSTSRENFHLKGFVFIERVRLPCSGANSGSNRTLCRQSVLARPAIITTDGRVFLIQLASPSCSNQQVSCLLPQIALPAAGSFVKIDGSTIIVPAKAGKGVACDPVSCQYIYGIIIIQSWTMIAS